MDYGEIEGEVVNDQLKKAVQQESLEATVVIKMPGDDQPTLFDIRQLLLSGRYKLEVALPNEPRKDKLALIFTEVSNEQGE